MTDTSGELSTNRSEVAAVQDFSADTKSIRALSELHNLESTKGESEKRIFMAARKLNSTIQESKNVDPKLKDQMMEVNTSKALEDARAAEEKRLEQVEKAKIAACEGTLIDAVSMKNNLEALGPGKYVDLRQDRLQERAQNLEFSSPEARDIVVDVLGLLCETPDAENDQQKAVRIYQEDITVSEYGKGDYRVALQMGSWSTKSGHGAILYMDYDQYDSEIDNTRVKLNLKDYGAVDFRQTDELAFRVKEGIANGTLTKTDLLSISAVILEETNAELTGKGVYNYHTPKSST